MNKLNSLKDSSFANNDSHDERKRLDQSNNNLDKLLCDHCGRTASNGIRCLGICVSDNEY